MADEPNRTRPVVTATCCRPWPVDPRYPVGHCGLCGQVPVFTFDDRNPNVR